MPAEFKVVRFTLLSSVAWHSVPCTDELRASGRKSHWARRTELLTSEFITKMCYAQASGKKDKDLKFYSIVSEDTVKKAETDVWQGLVCLLVWSGTCSCCFCCWWSESLCTLPGLIAGTKTPELWRCPVLLQATDYLLGLLPQDKSLIFSANKALQGLLDVIWYVSGLSIPKWALKQLKRKALLTGRGVRYSSVVTDNWCLTSYCNTGRNKEQYSIPVSSAAMQRDLHNA